jgi:thiol-disulfide isomerase/thioredoxin
MHPRSLVAILLLCALPAAQDSAPASRPDAELRTAHAAWQAKWKLFTDASMKARQEGRIPKGALLPPDVAELQRAADQERDLVLARFGQREDLSAQSFELLARLHEANRDYRSAADSYTKSLAAGDRAHPDLGVLHSLCIAAMNSKDDALAARWMRTTIEVEDRAGQARRNLQVRISYYPRTLIGLGDWKGLDEHLAKLAKDEAPACRAAAKTFGLVSRLHAGDVAGAEAWLAEIRNTPEAFPDHQAWAVLAELALRVGKGQFDEGAQAVRDFLAQPEPEGVKRSAVDTNQRKYLAAVAPFLGKPAPALRVDSWVGGEVKSADVLTALRGRIVVLDFWQSWCEPCRMAMPKLVALQKEHPAEVQVLGLCRVEDYGYDVSEKKAVRPIAKADFPAHVADFRADMAINYPLAIADTRANNDAYKVAGIPTLVVIDRAGIVRYMSCGAGEPGLFELAMAGVLAAKQ